MDIISNHINIIVITVGIQLSLIYIVEIIHSFKLNLIFIDMFYAIFPQHFITDYLF